MVELLEDKKERLVELLNPKKVKINFKIISILSKPLSNVKIKLLRIDDYFHHKPNKYLLLTNKDGYASKIVFEGAYLTRYEYKKSYIEKIVDTTFKKSLNLKEKMPFLFGLIKYSRSISENKIDKVYQNNRTDVLFCFKCKKKYKFVTDRFLCPYCGKYFCSEHRIPENHNCWGKPRTIKTPYRVVYKDNSRYVEV